MALVVTRKDIQWNLAIDGRYRLTHYKGVIIAAQNMIEKRSMIHEPMIIRAIDKISTYQFGFLWYMYFVIAYRSGL